MPTQFQTSFAMNKNKCIFKNERTLASAGSGKTYALTNRFIALVASGVNPEEICALTFTRKSAAEFFDKTMTKLAKASKDEDFADNLSLQLNLISPELGKLSADDFKKILAKFAKASPSLSLETIDSFTSRFARFFASELGLIEGIEILDDFALSSFKDSAIFNSLNSLLTSKDAFNAFAQAFKEANFGNDSKSVTSKLESFVSSASDIFLNKPNIKDWGAPKVFLDALNTKFDEAFYLKNLENLEVEFSKILDPKESKTKLPILNFFKDSNSEIVSKTSASIISKLAVHFAENKTSLNFICTYPYRTKEVLEFLINSNEAKFIDALIIELLNAHKKNAYNAAIAIFKILAYYESFYDSQARMRGKMTFSDMPYLICRSKNDFARELVEYRFDSKFSHWLFDEFQDTSRIQWQVFDSLISEAVLNSEGEKTFYYVGDKKQSIYAWRGGDSDLFDEILEKFKSNITDNPQIKTSWRSCPSIINFVNDVFSDSNAIGNQYGYSPAQKWEKDWQPHDVAKPNLNLKGEVSAQFCDEDNAANAVYNYIKKINPIARGLSVAVLVQRNSMAENIIETIRLNAKNDGLNLRVAGELEIKIASDNQAIPALLSLLQSLEHPLDTFASAYLNFTPLKNYFNDDLKKEQFLKSISDFGFKIAFEPIVNFLISNSENKSDFTRLRLQQFLEASGIFDAKFERNSDKFIKFINDYKVREGAASDTIQVMSIHKSKGLDFDIVILPELSNPKGNHNKIVREVKGFGAVVLPQKSISQFDKKLSEIGELIADEDSYANLCKFYVALTRAKRAIHLILPDTKDKKQSQLSGKRNFAYLVSDLLSNVRENPDGTISTLDSCSDWFKEFEEILDVKNPKAKTETLFNTSLHNNLETLSFQNFPFEIQHAKIIGLAVHSILENLDLKNSNFDSAIKKASALYENFKEDFLTASQLVSNAIKNEDISEIFKCKNSWIEFPFTIFKNSQCINGRFDRVNFYQDKAEIIDFKTDKDSSKLAEIYKPQLLGYADALSHLKNIKKENIKLKIVSISDSKIIEIKV